MKLANPVTNFIPELYPKGDVTQWYGENKSLYSTVCNPSGCITGGHNGIDIVRPYGSQIFCVSAGLVVETLNKDTGYGSNVRVLGDDGYEWIYAHLSKIDMNCVLGKRVTRGEPIAKMGNTGFVVSGATPYWKDNPYAGTHLHLGKRKVDIWNGTGQWNVTYFSGTPQEIRGVIRDYNNGTFGAVPIVATDFDGYTPPPAPVHRFIRNLEYGMMNDPDVRALQDILKYEGYLAKDTPSTGNYLNLTAQAVKRLQLAHGLVTQWHATLYGGKYCYEITRAYLNRKYGG